MKIAIPLFGERISPHFGSSSQIMMVELQENVIRENVVWDVAENGPVELAQLLVDMGAERLLCGGIERTCRDWLTSQGVQVVDNQKGKAEEIIVKMIRLGAFCGSGPLEDQ